MTIRENLNEIKFLVKNNRVIVTGHKITDVDSYVSSILMANLLNNFGINAIPMLLINFNEVDDITKAVLSKLNCPILNKVALTKKDYVFLVDHNDIIESFGGINAQRIVGIVDHHTDNNLNAIFKRIQKAGSTTRIIYDIYKEMQIKMSKKDIRSVLYSLSVDTCAFMSNKATSNDKIFAEKLAEEIGIKFDILKKETLFETDINFPVDKLLRNGFKKYNFNEKICGSCYIEYFGDTKEKVDNMILLLEKMGKTFLKDNKGHDGYIIILKDFTNADTKVYFYNTEVIQFILDYNYIASRGNTIVPDIRNML